MNISYKRLTDTITYGIKDDILFIKNTSNNLTIEEVMKYNKFINEAAEDEKIRAVITDNTEAKGVARQEILKYLDDSTESILKAGKKFYVISESIIAKNQINRISRQHKTEHLVKAFYDISIQEIINML